MRRHPRVFGTGVFVRIDSHTYPAVDASISGIRLRNCHEDYPTGMSVNIEIQITVANQKQKLPARATVLRNDTDGLVLRFKTLPSYTKRIYEDFINISALDLS